MPSSYDLNSVKKKLKDPNYQNVQADAAEEENDMTPEEMDDLVAKRAEANKKNRMMNRHTLYGDKYGFTEKARKNLANDPRY